MFSLKRTSGCVTHYGWHLHLSLSRMSLRYVHLFTSPAGWPDYVAHHESLTPNLSQSLRLNLGFHSGGCEKYKSFACRWKTCLFMLRVCVCVCGPLDELHTHAVFSHLFSYVNLFKWTWFLAPYINVSRCCQTELTSSIDENSSAFVAVPFKRMWDKIHPTIGFNGRFLFLLPTAKGH